MPAQMLPCLDHVALDRAHRHAKLGDLGMGQFRDAIEQKGIAAEGRQLGEGGVQPPQLHRASRCGFGTGRSLRIAGKFEALARRTQTNLGLSREIPRQIGGNAKEVGARMFERRGVTSLEEIADPNSTNSEVK